jgi:hypothetical protein
VCEWRCACSPLLITPIFSLRDIQIFDGGHYTWPKSTSPMGWPEHDPKKHGPRTAWPIIHSARAWPGPPLRPCLGRQFGPQCQPRPGPANMPCLREARFLAVRSPPPHLLAVRSKQETLFPIKAPASLPTVALFLPGSHPSTLIPIRLDICRRAGGSSPLPLPICLPPSKP